MSIKFPTVSPVTALTVRAAVPLDMVHVVFPEFKVPKVQPGEATHTHPGEPPAVTPVFIINEPWPQDPDVGAADPEVKVTESTVNLPKEAKLP